jgi:AcrR family transcriptional regulator
MADMTKNPSDASVKSLARTVARKRSILQAARQAFEAKGYDEVSMAEIAAGAGIVEGTIYVYYESKKHLMHCVVADWYAKLIDDVAQGLANISGTQARLRFCILRHLRVYAENTGLASLVIRELRRDRSYYETEVYELNRKYTAFVSGILKSAVEAGEVSPELPTSLIRDLIFGGMEHACSVILSGRGQLDLERTADQLLATIWSGIALPGRDASGSGQLGNIVETLAKFDKRLSNLERVVIDGESRGIARDPGETPPGRMP